LDEFSRNCHNNHSFSQLKKPRRGFQEEDLFMDKDSEPSWVTRLGVQPQEPMDGMVRYKIEQYLKEAADCILTEESTFSATRLEIDWRTWLKAGGKETNIRLHEADLSPDLKTLAILAIATAKADYWMRYGLRNFYAEKENYPEFDERMERERDPSGRAKRTSRDFATEHLNQRIPWIHTNQIGWVLYLNSIVKRTEELAQAGDTHDDNLALARQTAQASAPLMQSYLKRLSISCRNYAQALETFRDNQDVPLTPELKKEIETALLLTQRLAQQLEQSEIHLGSAKLRPDGLAINSGIIER